MAGWLVTSDLAFTLSILSVGCPYQSNSITPSVCSYFKGCHFEISSNVEPILSVSVAHTVISHVTVTLDKYSCLIVHVQ